MDHEHQRPEVDGRDGIRHLRPHPRRGLTHRGQQSGFREPIQAQTGKTVDPAEVQAFVIGLQAENAQTNRKAALFAAEVLAGVVGWSAYSRYRADKKARGR